MHHFLEHVTCHLIRTNILTIGMSTNQTDFFQPFKKFEKNKKIRELKLTPKFLCQCRLLVMGFSFGESSYAEDGKATSFFQEKDAVRMGDSAFLFSARMVVVLSQCKVQPRGRIAAIEGVEGF